MKRFIGILAILMVSISFLSAQYKLESLDTLGVDADTGYVEVDYDIYYGGVKYSDATAGYQFTLVNYTDTLAGCYLEGSNDGTQYIVVDSLTTLSTAGNYYLFDTNCEYLKYRLRAKAATGDAASLKNIIYTERYPKK